VAVKRAACLARYHYALPLARGKSVCDAACGVGYGSAYLAGAGATRVIGMDLDSDVIAWANQYYKRDTVRFVCANLCEEWPVSERFDVITSFETLEHLDEPERFLAHVDGHLSPDGRVLLSVPNGLLDLDRHPDDDRHVNHFSADELWSLVGRRFPSMDCFSQIYRTDVRHYVAKALRGWRTTRRLANYTFVPGLLPDAKTWLLVAGR
jgi:2-polyprenyl-3-methyl-5-hydroxy-6-metoxy-1,4-benzoquinol methylase